MRVAFCTPPLQPKPNRCYMQRMKALVGSSFTPDEEQGALILGADSSEQRYLHHEKKKRGTRVLKKVKRWFESPLGIDQIKVASLRFATRKIHTIIRDAVDDPTDRSRGLKLKVFDSSWEALEAFIEREVLEANSDSRRRYRKSLEHAWTKGRLQWSTAQRMSCHLQPQ